MQIDLNTLTCTNFDSTLITQKRLVELKLSALVEQLLLDCLRKFNNRLGY